MSSSSHSFNFGVQGPTGDKWFNPGGSGAAGEWGGASGYAATGPTGATGEIGRKGLTGPTGETGPSITGITYSSTGPNAHHIVVQFTSVDGRAATADGGFYRGPTGSSIYYLFGENTGYATAGVFVQKSENGILYLKSITGGNSLKVEESKDGKSIRIRYKTFDAVTAHGETGALVYATQNSAGVTGISGATLTHYYGGPTYSLKITPRTYNEVSSRLAPSDFNEETHTFIYKFNPVDSLSLKAAQKSNYNQVSGNVYVVDPNKDYESWFGGTPKSKPFIRFLDSSDPENNPDEWLEKFVPLTTTGFTLVVIDGKTLEDRTNHAGETVSYSYEEVFPSNWKFVYSLPPIITSDIDILQFITLGDKDTLTEKTEWYGMYVRTEKDINPFSW